MKEIVDFYTMLYCVEIVATYDIVYAPYYTVTKFIALCGIVLPNSGWFCDSNFGTQQELRCFNRNSNIFNHYFSSDNQKRRSNFLLNEGKSFYNLHSYFFQFNALKSQNDTLVNVQKVRYGLFLLHFQYIYLTLSIQK